MSARWARRVPPQVTRALFAKKRLEATSKAMLPYLAVLIVGVLVVAFVPWFTLAVPRLVQGH